MNRITFFPEKKLCLNFSPGNVERSFDTLTEKFTPKTSIFSFKVRNYWKTWIFCEKRRFFPQNIALDTYTEALATLQETFVNRKVDFFFNVWKFLNIYYL